MPSLLNMGSQRANQILESVGNIFSELEERVDPLRESLLEKGLILAFDKTHNQPSVVTVDGGVVFQQLPALDLLTSCAVSAEGILGRKHYSSEDTPKLEWATVIRDHDSQYQNVGTKVMSLQEMILLEDSTIKNHDYRIIDGSWTSAQIPVLMSLLQNNAESRIINDMLLDGLEKDLFTKQNVIDSIIRRNMPWVYDDGEMVAISKSDSQRFYSRIFQRYGVDPSLLSGISDRTLATLILQPGEMLSAVPLHKDFDSMDEDDDSLTVQPFNPLAIAGYNELMRMGRTHRHDKHNDLQDIYLEISNSGLFSSVNHNNRLRSTTLKQFNEEQWGWSFYFKPHTFTQYGRPLKLDFIRPPEMNSGRLLDDPACINNRAKEIASAISEDTAPGVKEPMSQYHADVQAKVISEYARYLVDQMAARSTSNRMLYGIIGSYRT